MPSITKSWVTDHESLSLLHITSNDPRRKGKIDLAFFDSDIKDKIENLQWCIRREVPFCNQINTTLANHCARIYGVGTERFEPNEDYTRSNYHKRGKVDKATFITSVASKRKTLHLENFSYKEFKSFGMDDVIEVEVAIQCKRTMKILIRKRHVAYIPKKLFFSLEKNQLCLWPSGKNGRLRHRTITLGFHIMGKVNNNIDMRCLARDPSHLNNYVVREDCTGYEHSLITYNKFYITDVGTVIEIGGEEGVYRECWEDRGRVYVYPRGFIQEGQKRSVYCIVSNDAGNIIRETSYLSYNQEDISVLDESNKRTNLPRYVANIYGLQVKDLLVPARENKIYARAIEKGIDGYKTRAKYENRIMSDKRTNNGMHVKARVYKFKRVYADTTVEVTLPDGSVIFALDCRKDALIVGGTKRKENTESKPLTMHEVSELLNRVREKQPVRNDI